MKSIKDLSDANLAKILWDYNRLGQKIKKTDVIIVLGSHDIKVAQTGAEIFLKKYAPKIVFSGGIGRLTDKLWTRPEAEVFSEEAYKMGVPKEAVFIESKSTNTEENIRFSMDLLHNKKIKVGSVILVHKPYMERRQFATWKKLFPNIPVIVTSPQIPFKKYISDSIVSEKENIHIIVGETQRIREYPKRGFIIKQVIPNYVWSAYKVLCERGYTDQLIKN